MKSLGMSYCGKFMFLWVKRLHGNVPCAENKRQKNYSMRRGNYKISHILPSFNSVVELPRNSVNFCLILSFSLVVCGNVSYKLL